MKQRWINSIPLISTLVLWGSSFPMIKVALQDYSPLDVATLRFVFASLALLIIAWKRLMIPRIQDILILLTLGVVGVFSYHLLLNTGEQLTTAATAGFIVNCSPVFTLLLCYFFFNETISWKKILGAIFCAIGVVIIALANGLKINMDIGVLYLILAALCWSLFFILQKLLLTRYSPFCIMCYAIWIATLLLLAVHHSLIMFQKLVTHRTESTFAIIYLGIVATTLAYWLWAITLSYMNVAEASFYTCSVPIISALLSFLLLGETFNVWFIIGGLWIMVGMILVKYAWKR